MTTGNGSMIVASTRRNTRSRPGQRRIEKAYAAGTQATSVPTTVATETIALFRKYVPNGM